MPYKIKENDSRCPDGKPYSVVNSDTNDLRGCHPDKESATKQLQALYANVPDAGRSADGCCGSVAYTTPTTQVW